jgi:hypothetical protein
MGEGVGSQGTKGGRKWGNREMKEIEKGVGTQETRGRRRAEMDAWWEVSDGVPPSDGGGEVSRRRGEGLLRREGERDMLRNADAAGGSNW